MDFETFKQKLFENPKFRKIYQDKTDISFEVSEMVHEARVRAGLTQAQLAKKIGTKQSSIARIESETALPSLSFLKKIAEALGVYLIPPKFVSFKKVQIETQTFKKHFAFDTDVFSSVNVASLNSGQKSVEQLINQ